MGGRGGGGTGGQALAALGARIERLSLDPSGVRAPLARLARPLLRVIGYRPRPSVEAAEALLEALRDPAVPGEALAPRVQAAARELAGNVKAAERACVVHGGLPPGEAAWLHRLHALVSRAARAAEAPADRAARRVAAAADPAVMAPLALAPTGGDDPVAAAVAAPAPGSKEAQRIALELLAIDHVIDAARAEASFLDRRRRLLEAARALLLDAAAALPLEARGLEERRRSIAAGIARIDRLEAAGLSAGVGLVHQARSALSRGDAQRLHAALVALEGAAITAGDARAAAGAGAALDALWGGDGWTAPRDDVERSAREALGAEVADAVRRGYEAARAGLVAPGEDASRVDREVHELVLSYLAPGCEGGAFAAALAVDGCFDVGAALAPVRVTEVELRARAVPYPTDELILLPARGVEDLPSAIIEDPRAILPSLAMGRLLARRFVRREPVRRQRTRLVGEVRVYVLDGSTSMLEGDGARARVRDAILLGELATLIRRFDARAAGGTGTRVVLFYRYFTKQLGSLSRVASGPAAVAAIGDVLGHPRTGGTDIEQALLSSFAVIREQGREDPDLARAQIVLVTDGEARVREEVVQAAREQAGAIPIQVSVIALGEENPALRALVARQRAQGERAFYHHVGDEALREICEGRLSSGPSVHAPAARAGEATALRSELDGLLEELATLEGEAARKGGRNRDGRAIAARFERWFPRPPAKAPPEALPPLPEEGTPARADLEAAQIVLATVAEVTRELWGSPLARQVDAIEILERLLPDAGLSPGRYRAVLRDHGARLAPALAEIHALTRDGGALPRP